MCEICIGYDVSLNGRAIHIVVRNYLEFDQLSPRQEAEMIAPRPQAEGFRMGDGWLMPALFRRLEYTGSRISSRIVKEPPPLIALTAT
jgi:hypothetical protein